MDIETDKREATVFAGSLVQQVNTEDVANMVHVQRGMLQRFEKTNEMLINFNQLSFTRYEASVKDFQQHTQLLYDMKKDLDSIFKRIRVLKQRLSKSYPEAFAACSSVIMMGGEEAEDEEDINSSISTTASTSATTTQTAVTTQPTTQPPHHASSGATKTTGDVDSSAGKIAQPQKTRSKSSKISRKGDCGSGASHRTVKTSQSMKETSSRGKSESKGSGSSGGSGGQSHSKLI